MKLHVLSDIHLEFFKFEPDPASFEADVIVLAGDIWKDDGGIHWARACWPDKEIIYVAGNHEFYGKNRLEVLSKLRIAARATGVHFLDDGEIIIDGVRFLGCTLWTDFCLFGEDNVMTARLIAERGMSDYRVIHEGPAHFSTADSIRLHEQSIDWLEMKLKKEEFTGKTVVVTHHLPSFDSVPDRYKHGTYNGINPAYASNLDHMLGSSHLWIHGHTHDSFDYVKNGTRVICNPRGYVLPSHDHDNQEFNPQLIVEI